MQKLYYFVKKKQKRVDRQRKKLETGKNCVMRAIYILYHILHSSSNNDEYSANTDLVYQQQPYYTAAASYLAMIIIRQGAINTTNNNRYTYRSAKTANR